MPDNLTRRAVVLGGLAIVSGCGGQMHALRRRVGFAVFNERLLLHGNITRRTLGEFRDVMAQNPQITTLVLQDMPGPHREDIAIAFGRDVRARGLQTLLQSDGDITGAAVLVFLGGVQREMIDGAGIGLRGWQGARRAYVEEMLGNSRFHDFALQAAPADGIYKMTAQEIAQYGLLTAPLIVWNEEE